MQEDKSATLATNNDQYLFQPTAFSFDSLSSNSMKSKNPHSGCRQVDVAKTRDTTDPNPCKNQGGIAIVEFVIDRHILDDQGGQQINVRTDGKSPTLRAEMHGNVPCVMQREKFLFENHSQDTRYRGPLEVCPMLPAQLGTGGNNTPFVVEAGPAYSIQGNTIDRNAQQNGSGICENVSHTINAVDRHGVAYGIGNGQANQSFSEELVGALNCMHDQQAVAYGVDCRNATEYPEMTGALQADAAHNLNSNNVVRTCYIVRRLTPTECARLQGFADEWGHIGQKETLTPEEYAFWLEVRNTHAAINGKAVKEYTEKQMLTWYNKLHTDSAEYKMWGNGIALPPALYCMQGITDALGGATE